MLALLSLYACTCSAITYPKGTVTPIYIDGAGAYAVCHKTTTVFGVHVCFTKKAWATGSSVGSKLNHIVQVLYQLLDNDGDGNADAPLVVAKMIQEPYFLYVPTEGDADRRLTGTARHRQRFLSGMPNMGVAQKTGIEEAFPFSCDVPRWRGASQTDRTSWLAKRTETGDAKHGMKQGGGGGKDNGNEDIDDDDDDGDRRRRRRRRLTTATCCHNQRDATVEEVHHLIANTAQSIWPLKWKGDKTSTAGQAAFAANGNCGWGYLKTYKDPKGLNPTCTGQYAYDDVTCKVECAVTEGLWWSSVTYIGGLFTDTRAASVANEYLYVLNSYFSIPYC